MDDKEKALIVLAGEIRALKELIEMGFKSNQEAHQRIEEHVRETNGNVKLNTKFRIAKEAQIKLLIALISFLGISNLVIIIQTIIAN